MPEVKVNMLRVARVKPNRLRGQVVVVVGTGQEPAGYNNQLPLS